MFRPTVMDFGIKNCRSLVIDTLFRIHRNIFIKCFCPEVSASYVKTKRDNIKFFRTEAGISNRSARLRRRI